MGTKPRVWFPGAAYHVTARGNHRNDIFRDGEDFQIYLSIIEQALEFYKDMYEVICYCLMTNHVHLLIEAKEKQLGYFIGRVNSMYARYFNGKYNYTGHLFQDRYFSELIEDDKQMLTTSQYIHLNPVIAKMVSLPEEYQWSSYSMIIGLKKEKLINSKKILSYFKSENSRQKSSGPIMDRIDIQKYVNNVDILCLSEGSKGPKSSDLRSIVEEARKIQQERFKDVHNVNCNAQITSALIEKYCTLDDEGKKLFSIAYDRFKFSARSYHKFLKIARTYSKLSTFGPSLAPLGNAECVELHNGVCMINNIFLKLLV